MIAAKHTPGPWWVVDRGVRDSGGYICHTLPVTRYEGQEERFAEETSQREADMRLIAAAPELLAALKWHEQFKAREDDPCGSSYERVAEAFHRETGLLAPGKDCRVNEPEERQAAFDKWIADGIARTRAAIAKAEGRPA